MRTLTEQIDLRGKPIIVIDAEIENPIHTKKEPAPDNRKAARGWRDFAGMGISVLCAHDFLEDRQRVFMHDNASEFRELVAGRSTVVTFNGKGFDGPLIEETWGIKLDIPELGTAHVDLLELVRDGLGHRAKLESLLVSNGLPGKTGKGVLAPELWHQRRIGELIDYCMGDVHRTAMLLLRALLGPLVAPDGREFNLDLDLEQFTT